MKIPSVRSALQVQVDAYAVQHPGEPGRRAAQSVGIHLMTLCHVLGRGGDPHEGPRLHRLMVARPVFAWLEPPQQGRSVTVADVLTTRDASGHVVARSQE